VGSKRRRTKAEVQADKEANQHVEQEVQMRLQRIRELEAELTQSQQAANQHQTAQYLMQHLLSQGHLVVDENGDVRPPQNQESD
jgi:outer membrane lipoprotein-sorting protein